MINSSIMMIERQLYKINEREIYKKNISEKVFSK